MNQVLVDSFVCHTKLDTCINLDKDTMYEVVDLSIVSVLHRNTDVNITIMKIPYYR